VQTVEALGKNNPSFHNNDVPSSVTHHIKLGNKSHLGCLELCTPHNTQFDEADSVIALKVKTLIERKVLLFYGGTTD
jgi:hypothetical protein